MAESIKEIADRLFNANQPLITDPFPPREISLEEMLSYRARSEQKLKEKRGKRKRGDGKESTDSSLPCPRCNSKDRWSWFPDGRGYCLSCGAVMEIDGTVTGGSIKKEFENKEENKMIEGEKIDRCDNPKRDIFVCNNCRDFNNCSQKNIDAIICLLISIDMKLKKMLGR